MPRLDDLFTELDPVREHEWPRFPLQRRRLSLGGILAGGYDVTTTIRGVRCRFTAILCEQDTTYGLGWDISDGSTLDCLETLDRALVTELFRHFIGFTLSVIEAEPAIRAVGFTAAPGEHFRMRFYTTATEVITRRWQATSVIKSLTYTTEFRITLPEHP